MPVYNYLRARCADGEVPADDAPAFVVTAVERWLARQSLAGTAAISVGELAEPRLTLLALHGEDGGTTDFVHVVVVTDRRLADPSPKALRRMFESLYGGRLERTLSALRAELARVPYAELAPRVLRHFAAGSDVESLRWSRGWEAGRSAPAGLRSPRGFLSGAVAVAAGALALLLGVVAGAQLAKLGDVVGSDETEAELRAEIAALEGRLAALSRELREDVADRRMVVARIERALAESRGRVAEAPESGALDSAFDDTESETRAPVESAVEQAREPIRSVAEAFAKPAEPELEPASDPVRVAVQELEPPPEETATPVSAPAVLEPEEPLPSVAASPPAIVTASYRIMVDTARVRSAPSSESATRGLLARGTRVAALTLQGDWIEIDPPEGFNAPAWLHVSLVEERP